MWTIISFAADQRNVSMGELEKKEKKVTTIIMIVLTGVIHNGCKLSKDNLIADLRKAKTIAKVFHSRKQSA